MVLVAKKIATVAAAVVTLGSSTSSRLPHTPVDGSQTAPLPADLQRAREAVWRAWFANDRETLERMLPDDFVGIGWGGGPWDSQETALAGAAGFAASGGRLTALTFTDDRWQRFGDVATVFSNYRVVLQIGDAITIQAGRATEVFVRRDGEWVNPAWHLDSGQ